MPDSAEAIYDSVDQRFRVPLSAKQCIDYIVETCRSNKLHLKHLDAK